MDFLYLWLQSEVLKQAVKDCKARGEDNPADLMTKYLAEQDIAKCRGGEWKVALYISYFAQVPRL